MTNRSLNIQVAAAIEIGSMLRGADMVKLAIAEMILAGKKDLVTVEPDNINGLGWDWEWFTPSVLSARVKGLNIEFWMPHGDLTWRGEVLAVDVVDKLVEMMEEK